MNFDEAAMKVFALLFAPKLAEELRYRKEPSGVYKWETGLVCYRIRKTGVDVLCLEAFSRKTRQLLMSRDVHVFSSNKGTTVSA